MRFRWLLLLSSFLSILVFSGAAQARQLVFWRFDSNQNRLVFTTDEGVQPRAQLIANPTRLVIDLPGIMLERSTTNQQVGGAIKEVRVGQFDNQTTRIVIELAPGYTLDPQQVKFRGASPTQWTVDLPTPQRLEASSSPPPQTRTPPNRNPSRPDQSVNPVATSPLQLNSFQVTRNGFFISTSGNEPTLIKVQRSRDRRRIEIDLEGATLSQRFSEQQLVVNRYGVSQIQFQQTKESPPVVRMTLNVDRDSPDWQALFNRGGGLVVLPRGTPASNLENSSSEPSNPLVSGPPESGTPNRPVSTSSNNQLATIQSVELANNQTQLLIQTDRRVRATTTWDASAKAYRITIPDAKLADRIRGPQLSATSPLSSIKLRQQDDRTVVILVQPSSGIQIGDLNQLNDQLLALQLRSIRPVNPPTSSIPVPPPDRTPPPISSPPPISPPNVPRGRVVVIIDPGHGGKDPGAIGIGGLREKDIVLPVAQQVASILEQQGIQAMLTRNSDYFVDLPPRVAMAEQVNARIFVSIHANAISLSRPDVNGLETYYYSSGQGLAQTIHNSILQSVNVGNRGVRRARFYVLRKSSMPSVLVEMGFVTGRDDAAKLSDANYRSQMANAIARGILQYIQQNL
ncbi:MAG TPA: N-acetylmuramoyl-L-alanine amidase [Cyanobacteria bacterium UBA8803]|nr:N-acetylmuramoyl-L-alanine amidase [Cyanobacteria bacterium UBA9273]HBL59946.1 N-acetylmuramoyl-L-alanine amidase [Cyanobacteria bacterium UBA8803]